MAVLCLLVVLPAAGRVFWASRRTMRADEEAFTTIEGVRVPYTAIREVDKSRWQRKSIAVVTYELDGRRRRTKIDDWIFAGGEDVLQRIEERLADNDASPDGDTEAAAAGKGGPGGPG
jgi:hypothetical protein